MKQLTDDDILQMAGVEYTPDDLATKHSVRRELKLSTRIPKPVAPTPEHVIVDLHMKTVEQAWNEIMSVATSSVRTATIITGASGILHKLFPQWANESVLTPYILEFKSVNNGSYFVHFKRKK